MSENERYRLYCDLIAELDEAFSLIREYDSQLHDYNGVILYQAESQLIKLIGNTPGITAMECAAILKKTTSACSQLLKKLRQKGWIRQERNQLNNRLYNLFLTKSGQVIYRNHKSFEESCYLRTYKLVEAFADKDFATCIEMLRLVNEGFKMDVEDGKNLTLDTK